jgi:hypothetical protein
MPRASKDCLTCDLGCGSLTQHSNDKYSFRQFSNFFKEIFYLSFPSTSTFALNECALHKVHKAVTNLFGSAHFGTISYSILY